MSRDEHHNPKLRQFKLSTRKNSSCLELTEWKQESSTYFRTNTEGSWIIITDRSQRLERPNCGVWNQRLVGLNIWLCSLYTAQIVPTEGTSGGWHPTSAPDQAVCSRAASTQGKGTFFSNLSTPWEWFIKFICPEYFTEMPYRPLFNCSVWLWSNYLFSLKLSFPMLKKTLLLLLLRIILWTQNWIWKAYAQ